MPNRRGGVERVRYHVGKTVKKMKKASASLVKRPDGFLIKHEGKTIRVSMSEALRFWIGMGVDLDRRLGGVLSEATAGGLGALRRAYLRRVTEGRAP